MTIDEKREAIKNLCKSYDACLDGCPLWKQFKGFPFQCGDSETDEEIERNYNIMMEAEKMAVVRRRPATAQDAINPSHYKQAGAECIDVILETQGVEATKGFCVCNAMKYLYRHNAKNGDEDIKKAKWYLDKYLEIAEKKEAE